MHVGRFTERVDVDGALAAGDGFLQVLVDMEREHADIHVGEGEGISRDLERGLELRSGFAQLLHLVGAVTHAVMQPMIMQPMVM